MNDSSLMRTKVDLSGLMAVLGEHLYSTPTVALRELVQNAHDSCHRRRIEAAEPFEPRIDVRVDAARGTLTIEDTGAGLTREEIESYLATVGAGYTRTLRDAGAHDELIGYFGLGFLSAFVIADRTEVHTCSYQEPERAWLFSSRSGQTYHVSEAQARPVGTAVTLHLRPRFADLADAAALSGLLARYCCLLEHPIHCAGAQVNAEPPPWRDEDRAERSALRRKTLALAFAQRFEPDFKPLFCVPVTARSESDPCRGVIWVQDGLTYGTSDNRNVWVFVRGMMVTDEDRDLLPAWAGFAGCVIESDALMPTASRESVQKNEVYQRAADQIRESLIEGLAQVASTDPESWQRTLVRHNEALLGAALCDSRLFELLCRDVTVPTSQGDLTVPAVLERSRGELHVTQGDERGFEELLFRALKVPVVRGTRYAALPFCRMYTERKGGSLVMVGTGRGDRALFGPASLPAGDAERLTAWFAADDVEVVLARFEPAHLPLVLVPDREVELKRRIESDEARRSIATAALRLARIYTDGIHHGPALRLYVNVDCPAIRALLEAPEDRRTIGVSLLRAFVGLTGDTDGADDYGDADASLQRLCSAVVALLA